MNQGTEEVGPKKKCMTIYKKGQSTPSRRPAKARMTEKAIYVEDKRPGGSSAARQGSPLYLLSLLTKPSARLSTQYVC